MFNKVEEYIPKKFLWNRSLSLEEPKFSVSNLNYKYDMKLDLILSKFIKFTNILREVILTRKTTNI